MELVRFSTFTAQLLKEQIPKIEELPWTNENENTSELDLKHIKQLQGCRTGLVQNSLKLIKKLDDNNKEDRKKFAQTNIVSLVDALHNYLESCEAYARLKDFLNHLPNYGGEGTFFVLLVTVGIAIASPPFAVIPAAISFLILMDLVFNNRPEAKKLQEKIFAIEDDLSTIFAGSKILEGPKDPSPSDETSMTSGPSTSNEPFTSAIPGRSGIDNVASNVTFAELSNLPSCSYGTTQTIIKPVINNQETSFSSDYSNT